MLTAGFGLSVPLPGMVPQHVLSSAQVSDAHIAHSADEETTAEEAALAAEAAESAAESAAAMVTAMLEVAAARQKVSQAEKAMVTALREAFADASEADLATTTAAACELDSPLEYSAHAEVFVATVAAKERVVEEGWEVRRRVLDVERSIASDARKSVTDKAFVMAPRERTRQRLSQEAGRISHGEIEARSPPPPPPPLAPPPNPERSARSAAVLVERQKAATAAAEDGLAEDGLAAVEIRVVESREGELQEIRVHLPNGFPGRLPVSSPAQIAASFPGRMPADFDTSATVAPPPRVGSHLFTRSGQAVALPPRFPPQPPPQPPLRRLSEETRQRSVEEPSQPSEAEVAGRSPCDGGSDGGSDDQGSDLEPDEMPAEWSTATPSPPPRLLRTASSSPPRPSGLDRHVEAVEAVEAVGKSSSTASSAQRLAVSTPAQPLSAKVGLRQGSQNIPLPQGPAPPPLRASTPRCGSPLLQLNSFDAGELEDEGDKENNGDAATPRAVCYGPDAPLQAPRCSTPRVLCATPMLGRSSAVDEIVSPSPTPSEVGPAPSPPLRKGRAVLHLLQPPPPPAAACSTELRDEDGDVACRRASSSSQPYLRSLGSQKTQQASRSRSVRFESPAGALALAAASVTQMKAMDMAWADADGVTDAWAAAKFAATAAAEAQAAAVTATQAAVQAQQAALCAAERAQALDRADAQPPSASMATPLASTDRHATPPARGQSGSLRSSKSFVRKGARKGLSPMQRLSLASPPALSESRSSKRCIGRTPFREEKEQHAQQAWLQEAEERAQAADAEALREDAGYHPLPKGSGAHTRDPPIPPPQATPLSSGSRNAASGIRELSEGATFLLQLRAIGRAS